MLLLSFCLAAADLPAAGPIITEFLAINNSGLKDENGDYSDWIELFNGDSQPVNLQGWFLTDDPGNLPKWAFPARTLLPGEYLVVFASGKDRAPLTGNLHASFRLSGDGGYLALVQPDRVTVQYQFDPYPPQHADVSFGAETQEKTTPLVSALAPVKYLVPQNSSLGLNWTGGLDSFDDQGWNQGVLGLGYLELVPGFAVYCYQSAALVEDLYAAEEVVATPALQARFTSENASVINYQGTATAGHYESDRPFPGVAAGVDADDLVVVATAKITIPDAGDWTFGVQGDDGFGLEIGRGENPFSLSVIYPRAPGDSLQTFTFAAAGDYDLRLIYYNRTGGSGLELFAVRGAVSNWNAEFHLVGDTAAGGLPVNAPRVSSQADLKLLDFIQTDVRSLMENQSASAYLRIPFVLPEGFQVNALFLNVRYNDGFIAYLNGLEVARRNAPTTAGYDSTASTNRPTSLALEPERINITAGRGRLQSGVNYLAIQALNDAANSPDFLLAAELENIQVEPATVLYFPQPTPGKPNSVAVSGFVEPVQFGTPHGFIDQPFDLTLQCPTEGAAIRYTTNGILPTATVGTVYTNSIRITKTTVVRAAAFKPNYGNGKVITRTYLFLNDVIAQDSAATLAAGFPSSWNGTTPDYGLDRRVIGPNGTDSYGGKYARSIKDDLKSVPTLSLVMNLNDMFGTSGIYANPSSRGTNWERAVSLELICPDGSPGFQENAGIRIQGGAFRSFGLTKKKSFRLVFRDRFGAGKLHYPFFGPDATDRFDTITLRAYNNDGYQWDSAGGKALYVRDTFALALARDMGLVAAHSGYVHLYINGFYWGLYNPVERPDASFAASYFGGQEEDWDAINYDSAPDGNYNAWNRMLTQARAGLANDTNYLKIQGLNPDGSPNPAYEDLLDMDSLIDYMILNCYLGNNDWPGRNYWVARNRNQGDGFKFLPWDTEWIVGLSSDLSTDKTGVNSAVAEPYAAAKANQEFCLHFADHVYRHFYNGGALSVDSTNAAWDPAHPERNRPAARFAAVASLVDRAVVGESARWGDQHAASPYTRDEHWLVELNNELKNYFPKRSSNVLAQFRQAGLYPKIDPPIFNQRGGEVPQGFYLTLSSLQGEIYYTTNGADPHVPVKVEEVFKATLVNSSSPAKVLIPSTTNGGSTLGDSWHGNFEPFNDSSWTSGSGGVGYDRETTYQPYIQIDVRNSMDTKVCSAFIRIYFNYDGTRKDQLNFMTLRMRYDDGFVAFLNGQLIASANPPATLTWNAVAPQGNADSSAVLFKDFKVDDYLPALKVGQNILAIHGLNNGTSSTDFLINAELIVGEQRVTSPPITAQKYTGPVRLDDLVTIKTRAFGGGEWSALNEAKFIVGSPSLVLTELHYHPAAPTDTEIAMGFTHADDFEFLELWNPGNATFDLSGCRFTQGIDFDFASSSITTLKPNQYALVVKNRAAFEQRYGAGLPVAGEFSGQLSNSGEQVVLENAQGHPLLSFLYNTWAPWPLAADGEGPSLEPVDPAADLNSPANWRASAQLGGSPGKPNPSAPFRATMALMADQRARLQFQTTAGSGYTLYGSESFSPPDWQILQRVDAVQAGGSVEIEVAVTHVTRYFRLSIP